MERTMNMQMQVDPALNKIIAVKLGSILANIFKKRTAEYGGIFDKEIVPGFSKESEYQDGFVSILDSFCLKADKDGFKGKMTVQVLDKPFLEIRYQGFTKKSAITTLVRALDKADYAWPFRGKATTCLDNSDKTIKYGYKVKRLEGNLEALLQNNRKSRMKIRDRIERFDGRADPELVHYCDTIVKIAPKCNISMILGELKDRWNL